MALVARISEVGYERELDSGDGTTSVDDLSLRGRFFVVAEYFDSNQPQNVLETQTFEFSNDTTVEQAQEAIVNFGQRVRDARIRVGSLRQFVGAVIPLV